MEKSCLYIARLAIQQLFPIQILLVFQFYISMIQTSNLTLVLIFFPALSISGIHMCHVLNLRVGRSRDP